MPLKTITLYPATWRIRDEPYGDLLWVPSAGGANMLQANDADYATSQSTTGLGGDSDSLDAQTFRDSITGALPVFEAGARNPALTIECVMGSTDGKVAEPYIYVYDDRFMGSGQFEQIGPFASVVGNGAYSHASTLPARVNVFDAMASGHFSVTCIFPARPPGGAIGLTWNQAAAILQYQYGAQTTPDPFNFVDSYGGPGVIVLSQVLAITGMNDAPQVVSISGDVYADFSIAGDPFSPVPRYIANGQTLQLRVTAPAVLGASANVVVQIESRSDAWRVTSGDDVPIINGPADQVNVMPGGIVQFYWQFSGHDVPFNFTISGWPGRYSTNPFSGAPTWSDAATPGIVPVGGLVSFEMRAPLGPSMTATPMITCGSTHVTDSVNITTGDENFIYSLDFSPIDTFQVAHAGQTVTWDAPVGGAARHASVASPPSFARGTYYSVKTSSLEVGRWWRLLDGTRQQWIAGTKILGIGYGSSRTNENQYAPAPTQAVGLFSLRDQAGGAYSDLPGEDATAGPGMVFVNGVAPGIVPAGWSTDAILAAINNDTLALGKWARLTDNYGFQPYVMNNSLALRVFFKVTRPPEGMVWEA